jgi:hypothetical protein
MRCSGSDPGDIVDEVPSICDLCTHIAKLSDNAVEEGILLIEWLFLVICISSGLLSLVSYIGVGDF